MRTLLSFSSSALLLAAVLAASAGDSRAEGASADELFRDAGRAYDARDYVRARALYERAFQQKKTHDIAAMLAQTEMKLGKPCAAEEHLAWAVANFPPSLNDDRRGRIERAHAAVKKRIGALHIRAEPAAASVQIDFEPVAPSALPGPICVPVGDRTVFVSLDGYAVERRIVNVEPGDLESLSVELRRIAPAEDPALAASAPGPRRIAAPVAGGGLTPVQGSALAAGAGALGALVAGTLLVSLGVDAGARAASLNRRIESRLGPGACPLPGSDALRGSPLCDELASLRASEAGLLNGGVWSFIGAASLGALSGGILLLGAPGGGVRPGGSRVTVGAVRDGAFIAVEGAF